MEDINSETYDYVKKKTIQWKQIYNIPLADIS